VDEARESAVAEALTRGHGGGGAANAGSANSATAEDSLFGDTPTDTASHHLRAYRIRFEPHADLLRKANEPLLLIRELRGLGRAVVQVDLSNLPPLTEIDPEGAYFAWTIDLETEASLEAIQEVFEFVVDDCRLDIQLLADGATPMAGEDAPVPETEGAVVAAAAPAVPAAAPARDVVVSNTGTAVAAPGAANAARPASGAEAHPAGGNAGLGGMSAATSIRVDLDKVDRLVNMVGEIVITQAMLTQQMQGLQIDKYPELIMGLEQMAQHTRELQESVMAIRAQPVKTVFARLPRLVRELASSLGKEIKLVTVGENTEVDKTVIEQLSDPLTHMIRNAIDHGVEIPAERVAAGKPEEGTIMLSAEHRGGRIVIEIADDGAGINRARVRQKAIEQGLIGVEQPMSDEDIDNLIFHPGLSTAKEVSNISGRGVGMDVVKKNLQELGGRVHVQSSPGIGSRFSLSLPLTLAVLDGMIVTVGAERYVIPLTSIIESLRPRSQDVSSLVGQGDVLSVRGEYVRLVHLARIFDISDAISDPTKGLVVLVEVEGGEKIGLVVDELLGQQQIVVKTLETNYRQIDGIAAATILGDGRVALILDVGGLSEMLAAQLRGGAERMAS